MTPEGLTTCTSKYGPEETMARLEAAVMAHGMGIVARIDHARAAAKVGMELRPTWLLIFGNARVGTPLMQAVPTIGIDLPLKALVWQDEIGQTWLAYSHPSWLAGRHGIAAEAPTTLERMTTTLAAVAQEAAGSTQAVAS
jgi:uncharacterized protein (DUF302 family)